MYQYYCLSYSRLLQLLNFNSYRYLYLVKQDLLCCIWYIDHEKVFLVLSIKTIYTAPLKLGYLLSAKKNIHTIILHNQVKVFILNDVSIHKVLQSSYCPTVNKTPVQHIQIKISTLSREIEIRYFTVNKQKYPYRFPQKIFYCQQTK